MTPTPALPGAQTSEGETPLVERLRADATEWDPATIYGAQETRDLERAAADEIERLQSELAAEKAAREAVEKRLEALRRAAAQAGCSFTFDQDQALVYFFNDRALSAEQSAREQIADTKRLDWLESNLQGALDTWVGHGIPGFPATWREAIDAAMPAPSVPPEAQGDAEPTEAMVAAGAEVIVSTHLIDAPRLPAASWMGLSRAVIKAALLAQGDVAGASTGKQQGS